MKMETSCFKISLVLLRIWLLFQLCPENVATDEKANREIELNKGSNETDLNGRMTHIEVKSQKQEGEIEVLKTLLEEERQFSKQLSGRISQLEASSANPTSSKSEEFLGRPKRPFRLLPPNIPLKLENKISNEVRFYGPPSSCKELGMLGYTLNGFYLVENENGKIKKGERDEIELVYCRFQNPTGTEMNNMEERVGIVKIVSKSQPKSSRPITVLPSKFLEEREQRKFKWKSVQTTDGPFLHADDCDFDGYDIPTGAFAADVGLTLEMCRDHCLKNFKCTHLTLNVKENKCLMKQAPNPANPLSFSASYSSGNMCGYFSNTRTVGSPSDEKNLRTEKSSENQFNWRSKETSVGKYFYADDCNFHGSDIGSSPALTSHLCLEQCLLNAQCTHTTWVIDGKKCWIKKATDLVNPLSFSAIYTKNNVCGYFNPKRTEEKSSEKIVTTERVSEYPFVWKSVSTSKGQYIFADDCEFRDVDYGVYHHVATHQMCRDKCLVKNNCTHTTWKKEAGRKICFTKQAPNPKMQFSLSATYEKASVCGYFSPNKTI